MESLVRGILCYLKKDGKYLYFLEERSIIFIISLTGISTQ